MMILKMSPEIAAVATLVVTLALALLIDRGAPNVLESIAFSLEAASARTVATLRRSATALRNRQVKIEQEHRERMAGCTSYISADAVLTPRSAPQLPEVAQDLAASERGSAQRGLRPAC